MKEFFTIGEISKLFNINAKTLRYYDEIDLFKPNYVDKSNKYRYYSIDQFEYLETIQYLKNLGLPLSKIKYHLNNLNIDSIVESLEYQKQIIMDKINELNHIQENINKKIFQIKDATRLDVLNKIIEIDYEERCVIRHREKFSYENVELEIRKLAKSSSYKICLTYGYVGISVSKEDLENRRYDKYDSAFMIIEENLYEDGLTKIFPKGKYLSIRYNGNHKDASRYYKELRKYIDENNYEIIDDSIEIQLVDPSLITCESEMVMEIQIPVRRKQND